MRKDPAARPQADISFVLRYFTAPGSTERASRNITGDERFRETRLDDMRVPCARLVGRLNEGWTLARPLRGPGHFPIGSPKACRIAPDRAAAPALARGLSRDPVTPARYTRCTADVNAREAPDEVFAGQMKRGKVPRADASLRKILASEIVLDRGGEAGAQVGGVETPGDGLDALFPLPSRPADDQARRQQPNPAHHHRQDGSARAFSLNRRPCRPR